MTELELVLTSELRANGRAVERKAYNFLEIVTELKHDLIWEIMGEPCR